MRPVGRNCLQAELQENRSSGSKRRNGYGKQRKRMVNIGCASSRFRRAVASRDTVRGIEECTPAMHCSLGGMSHIRSSPTNSYACHIAADHCGVAGDFEQGLRCAGGRRSSSKSGSRQSAHQPFNSGSSHIQSSARLYRSYRAKQIGRSSTGHLRGVSGLNQPSLSYQRRSPSFDRYYFSSSHSKSMHGQGSETATSKMSKG